MRMEGCQQAGKGDRTTWGGRIMLTTTLGPRPGAGLRPRTMKMINGRQFSRIRKPRDKDIRIGHSWLARTGQGLIPPRHLHRRKIHNQPAFYRIPQQQVRLYLRVLLPQERAISRRAGNSDTPPREEYTLWTTTPVLPLGSTQGDSSILGCTGTTVDLKASNNNPCLSWDLCRVVGR